MIKKKFYKINVKTSISLIKNSFVKLVDQSTYVELFELAYNSLESKLSNELVQIKPGRKFPRIVKAKNVKHHLNGT
jgi:hypothetical protein